MNLSTCRNRVYNIPKGSYTSVLWEREARVKKGCNDIIKKRVRATVRLGIDYENLASVKRSRATGVMSSVPSGLAWGKWNEFPYFIKHTPKNGSVTDYLRMYLGKGSNITTEWYLNGRKVDKAIIAPMVLASELKDEEITTESPITVKVADILAIG